MDSLTITIIFIFLTTIFGSVSRRIRRDKCLNDFSKDPVTLEKTNGEIAAKGMLKVENTGLEFSFPKSKIDDKGIIYTSYILYKYEYPQIQAIIRYHDELSEKGKLERQKVLDKTYHPQKWTRTKRKIQNIFKTINDSIKEVLGLIMTHFQKVGPAASVLKTQDKYVKKIKQDIVESVGTAHEPLIEKYIGHRIVFDYIKGGKIYKYSGVLKDYTSQFIEIMDVDYKINEESEVRLADIVIPQKLGIVRHLGEEKNKTSYKFLKGIKNLVSKD